MRGGSSAELTRHGAVPLKKKNCYDHGSVRLRLKWLKRQPPHGHHHHSHSRGVGEEERGGREQGAVVLEKIFPTLRSEAQRARAPCSDLQSSSA